MTIFNIQKMKIIDISIHHVINKHCQMEKNMIEDDIRGQCYDNGSNMKGKNQGVQRRLNINPKAFYISV